MATPNDAHGHRARLLQRFKEGGLRGGFTYPYEKLEFLLTYVLPRVDTKPLARALLKEFGSISAVLHAPSHKLCKVPGIGPKTALYLGLFHQVSVVLEEEQLVDGDLLNNPDLARSYLKQELSWLEAEYMLVIYLDNRCRLIHKERLLRGTIDNVPHYPRELVKEALNRNALGVILAHNHPSGTSSPSTQDVRCTRELTAALQLVGIKLHDHFVVGQNGITSMRELGMFTSLPSPCT